MGRAASSYNYLYIMCMRYLRQISFTKTSKTRTILGRNF